MIRIPSAITNIPEYLGSKASVRLSFCFSPKLASDGSMAKTKKITPPIHTEANKL